MNKECYSLILLKGLWYNKLISIEIESHLLVLRKMWGVGLHKVEYNVFKKIGLNRNKEEKLNSY